MFCCDEISNKTEELYNIFTITMTLLLLLNKNIAKSLHTAQQLEDNEKKTVKLLIEGKRCAVLFMRRNLLNGHQILLIYIFFVDLISFSIATKQKH